MWTITLTNRSFEMEKNTSAKTAKDSHATKKHPAHSLKDEDMEIDVEEFEFDVPKSSGCGCGCSSRKDY